jgi:P pilus assembly chaperone PapD
MMRNTTALGLFFPLLVSAYAHAGVVMGGTRVIYPQGKREVAFSITNMDKSTPYLIQSWIENFNSKSTQRVPFVVTPPLFRLDPEQKNVLRISYLGTPLASDRESIFLLNVKNISPSHKENSNKLQINVRSKFKIFFRPEGLKGDANLAYKQLTFTCSSGNQLTVHNPTAYFVSFYSVKIGASSIKEPGMVFPFSDEHWNKPCGGKVSWQAINDFGGLTRTAIQS